MLVRTSSLLSNFLTIGVVLFTGSCGNSSGSPVAVVIPPQDQLEGPFSFPEISSLPLISDIAGYGQVNPNGVSLATVDVIASRLGFPYGLDVNAAGNFIVVDYSGRLLEINSGGSTSVIASGLSFPTGVVMNGSNYLVVTFAGQLLEISPSGSVSVRATGLGSAYGVDVDGSDVIVTDYAGRLLWISGGSVSQVVTGIGNPAGVEVLGTDDYLVTDFVGGRLLRVTNGSVSVISTALSFPTEVLSVDGRYLVGEFGSTPGSGGRLLEVELSSGDLTEIASTAEVNGNVFGLAEQEGAFFATDFLNGGRLLQIEPDPVDECPTGVEWLADPGFEVQTPGTLPLAFGIWGGDLSETIGPENGILPLEGNQMLSFLATGQTGGGIGGDSAQLFQLVDLSSLSEEIDAGQVTVKGSAFFNRVAGDSETDTQFTLLLLAYGGIIETSGYPDLSSTIEFSRINDVISDENPSTWEKAESVFTLPVGTRFIAYELFARENVFDDAVNEFDGHYVDDTSLILCGFNSVPGGSGVLVNTLEDEDGRDPTECSLREAIIANNTSSAFGGCEDPEGTIGFDPSLSGGMITLSGSGLPSITEDVLIDGLGDDQLTVSGADQYRVFDIGSGRTVAIQKLTITEGQTPITGSGFNTSGAGIRNHGTLTITDSVISHNSSTNSGGGIYNSGSINLANSTLSKNSASLGGGISNVNGSVNLTSSTLARNLASFGGGVYNPSGSVSLTRSALSDNSASLGGGIWSDGRNIDINDSIVSGNYAGNDGGGIFNRNGGGGSTVNINNSTISSNSAGNDGSGIFNRSNGGLAIINVSNSTVSSNFAGNDGGGFLNDSNYASGGYLSISNSTISHNSAISGGGIFNRSGGKVDISSVIVSGNRATNGAECVNEDTFTSINNNLIGTNDSSRSINCSLLSSDIVPSVGVNQILSPLADNGGFTIGDPDTPVTIQTQALVPNSPAIDRGNCSGLTIDQRGFPKPVDQPGIPNAADGCDIGAFEVQ